MSEPFTVELTGERSARVVVGGDLDIATSHELREELYRILETGHVDLVVDLHGVGFIDSTGLGVLVGALRRAAAAGGALSLVVADGPVRDVFDFTGLAPVFRMDPPTTAAAPVPDQGGTAPTS